MKSVSKALVIVLAMVLVAPYVFGQWWALVDWLRNYGSSIQALPAMDTQVVPSQVYRHWPAGSFCGFWEDAINWYNFTFKSATRFGSGIGLIGGAIFAIMSCRRLGLAARIAAGAIGGALIGARSILMVTSDVPYFLVGLGLGSALAVVAAIVNDPRRMFPDLPPPDEAVESSSV